MIPAGDEPVEDQASTPAAHRRKLRWLLGAFYPAVRRVCARRDRVDGRSRERPGRPVDRRPRVLAGRAHGGPAVLGVCLGVAAPGRGTRRRAAPVRLLIAARQVCAGRCRAGRRPGGAGRAVGRAPAHRVPGLCRVRRPRGAGVTGWRRCAGDAGADHGVGVGARRTGHGGRLGRVRGAPGPRRRPRPGAASRPPAVAAGAAARPEGGSPAGSCSRWRSRCCRGRASPRCCAHSTRTSRCWPRWVRTPWRSASACSPLPVPSGLLVREALLVAILQPVAGAAAIVTAAIVQRLVAIAAEVVMLVANRLAPTASSHVTAPADLRRT